VPSYLHTCYRIGDIDRSVAFYEKLGFNEAGRFPIGDEAVNVFMGLRATRTASRSLGARAQGLSEASELLIRELDHRAAPAAPDGFRSSEHAAVCKELEPRCGSDLPGVNELVSARQ
jgi:catechol 2,3-dioxygenase-like lactoylglutathione lyase family enzyme